MNTGLRWRFTSLDSNLEVLLGAMIGAVAVIWSIGFIAYSFIWDYFWSWAKFPLKRRGRNARWSLRQNLGVYVAYLALTFLSAYSILASGLVLLSGNSTDVQPAWRVFSLTVVGYFAVFFFEVFTSVWKVWEMIVGRDP